MTVDTVVPLALHVPEPFTYTDQGLQRASDWVRYTVHAGLYPITYVTRLWTPIPGRTPEEAHNLDQARADSFGYPVDRTDFGPYYAIAELNATMVRSYYENQLLWATSGAEQEHDEPATVRWTPYAYEIRPGLEAYSEWVGTAGVDLKLVHHASVVEWQPCEECGAVAGEECRAPNCQGTRV